MAKKLKMQGAWLCGSLLMALFFPLVTVQGQSTETAPQGEKTDVAKKAQEVVSVAPAGARFMIPGRTLLLVSMDGTPPAVVDGMDISWEAYNTKLNGAAQAKFFHSKVPENKESELRAEVIEEVILENLLMNEAIKQGIEPEEEAIQKRLDAVELRYRGNEKWEEQRDRTLPKIRAEFVKRSLLALLEKKVRDVSPPSDEQVEKFYENNLTLFTEPVTQSVSVILLGVDPSSHTSVWSKAENEAKSILKKINNGGDFAAIAKLRSTDDSAAQGGDLGYLHQGMLSEEAQDVVDKMDIGTVSDPIRILQGYAIFKLNDRTQARLVSLDQSKKRAHDLYVRATSDRQWDDFQKDVRTAANVTINPILMMPKQEIKAEITKDVVNE